MHCCLGVLLIVMTLGRSFIGRLPLSAAVLYLGVGMAVGPWGWGLGAEGWSSSMRLKTWRYWSGLPKSRC